MEKTLTCRHSIGTLPFLHYLPDSFFSLHIPLSFLASLTLFCISSAILWSFSCANSVYYCRAYPLLWFIKQCQILLAQFSHPSILFGAVWRLRQRKGSPPGSVCCCSGGRLKAKSLALILAAHCFFSPGVSTVKRRVKLVAYDIRVPTPSNAVTPCLYCLLSEFFIWFGAWPVYFENAS